MNQKTYRLPLFHCVLACIAFLILGIGLGISISTLNNRKVEQAEVVTQTLPSPKVTPTPTLKLEDSTTLTLFFNNINFNPQTQDCSAVFPVTRHIPTTNVPLQATLSNLFAGPTEEEISQGYNSIFSESTKNMLNSVNFKNGTVYLDFNRAGLLKAIEAGANSSCGGAQFGASLQKTLLGVPGVKNVVFQNFSVDGNKKMFQDMMQ